MSKNNLSPCVEYPFMDVTKLKWPTWLTGVWFWIPVSFWIPASCSMFWDVMLRAAFFGTWWRLESLPGCQEICLSTSTQCGSLQRSKAWVCHFSVLYEKIMNDYFSQKYCSILLLSQFLSRGWVLWDTATTVATVGRESFKPTQLHHGHHTAVVRLVYTLCGWQST